jgi:hypothetical protein
MKKDTDVHRRLYRAASDMQREDLAERAAGTWKWALLMARILFLQKLTMAASSAPWQAWRPG